MELVIQPSGRTIRAAPGSNLLACLIEHSVPISFSCQDGRCGMCACRLLDGNVIEAGKRANEVPSTPRDQILACQTVLSEDCAVSIPDQESAVTYRPRKFRAFVSGISAPSEAVRELRLRPENEFAFSPGQYVEVEFQPGLVRRYSTASIPQDGELQLHVDLRGGGSASQYIDKTLKDGQSLKLRGPLGSTFLRQCAGEPIACLGAGVGVAAVLSLLKGMVQAQVRNTVLVAVAFQSEREAYALEELHSLIDALPNARKCLMIAFGPVRLPGARRGLLTDWIRSAGVDWASWRAYAFGSSAAIDSAARLLRQSGIPSSRLHVEAYYPLPAN